MKKLFVFGSLFIIFLFLFGCHSESPVSPSDQDVTSLEKGRQVRFTGDLALSVIDPGFVKITLNWNALKGAVGYVIRYYDLKDGVNNVVELPGSETSYVITDGMLQVSGYTCQVTIDAMKERKGQGYTFASGSQIFTYTGDPLVEITNITGGLTISSSGNASVLTADWNDVTDATNYGSHVYQSWGGDISLDGSISSIGPIAFSPHTPQNGDFISVIFRAWNGSTLIGIGNAKFTYAPPPL